MSDQLIFDFFDQKNCDNFKESDFVFFKQNENAKKFLEKFFTQDKSSDNALYSAILLGESQSGKTHILNIFAKKFSAHLTSYHELDDSNLANFFIKNNFYIIENIDEIKNEDLLFHILNAAFENKAFLVMSAKTVKNFHLKDLVSRIRNIPVTTIENIDENAIKMLLAARLAKKQLKIKDEILQYLEKNLIKKYQTVSDAIKMLDFFISENKKDLSLSDVKKNFRDLLKN